MCREFGRSEDELPDLKKIQNFVGNYRRRHMGGTDARLAIKKMIGEILFSGKEDNHEPFTFAWKYDTYGNAAVGTESDSDPFLVGITTKNLLLQVSRDPKTFVMHVDGTYKLNNLEYPIVVVGLSDRARTFHLLALFVTSHQTETQFHEVFSALRWIYYRVTGSALQVAYVMGDADHAQFNALADVFGCDSPFRYLMCFFHVEVKLVEKTRRLPSDLALLVTADVYDLHFSCSNDEFKVRKLVTLTRWGLTSGLEYFTAYFKAQWLTGKFSA
ncbi:unnamed protein product [Phytophthora fragariaefolia]|uniref:Unnamed protein product n=1 Tax=Phytophthora fragariaefolia TaxID=1490495 RepID=A0A9W6YNK7_9STRA|nr:unnamed protein product [Phytophthora fragariaefolia]